MKIGVAFGFSQLVNFSLNACLFLIAALVLKSGEAKQQDIFIAIFCMIFAGQEAGNSAGYAPDMGKAQNAARKIFHLLETPSKINAIKMDVEKKGIDVSKVVGKIEFKDVWFRYPTRKEDWVLRGLTLTINPRESVALVGESGCGKSTFVRLMMRFYDVDFGEILLDGVNIKEYNLHQLRMAISLVMQEPIIFNYTILDNILYGKLDASNREILESAEIANCNEFIVDAKNREKRNLEKEPPAVLLEEMENNKDAIIDMVGQEKYDEEIKVL